MLPCFVDGWTTSVIISVMFTVIVSSVQNTLHLLKSIVAYLTNMYRAYWALPPRGILVGTTQLLLYAGGFLYEKTLVSNLIRFSSSSVVVLLNTSYHVLCRSS